MPNKPNAQTTIATLEELAAMVPESDPRFQRVQTSVVHALKKVRASETPYAAENARLRHLLSRALSIIEPLNTQLAEFGNPTTGHVTAAGMRKVDRLYQDLQQIQSARAR